ncbi:MAG: hypothetical protein IH845_01775 [Nanoarchaeota archaeon]|nr:hypothetical protein [Nanoarchaeota archaeon]
MREQEVRQVIANPHANRFFSKKWIILSFIGVVLLLLFFAFSGMDFITGNVISIGEDGNTDNISLTENFKLYAELDSLKEVLELKQKIKLITIEVSGATNNVYLGKDGFFDLSGTGTTKILLEDFDGSISFDGDNIYLIKGKVTTVTINDFPTSSTDDSINVRIDDSMGYDFLELEGVYLKKYESLSSGEVKFDSGKITMQLDNETVSIHGFRGIMTSGTNKIGVQRTGITLDGFVEDANIGGDFEISLVKTG